MQNGMFGLSFTIISSCLVLKLPIYYGTTNKIINLLDTQLKLTNNHL